MFTLRRNKGNSLKGRRQNFLWVSNTDELNAAMILNIEKK
jgi:hypothetical protein